MRQRLEADLEEALDELYQSAPSEFTRKREAVAKRLRGRGSREAAQALRARRKPTQIAWVLNQLSRRHPDAVAELVDVGRQLAREQRKALRGEATSSFRESIERQRDVVHKLTTQTAALMKELGIDPSGHLDEIASALQAGLVDPAVGEKLEEGRLEKAPEVAASLAGPSLEGVSIARRTSPAKKPTTRSDAAKRAAAKARAERQASERSRKRAVVAARTALRAAEASAKKARSAAEKAESEARERVEDARRLADRAETSARAVEEARRKLVRARAGAP
ncbi:MAG: hypothetical protein K0S65_666 [Labilithrix sp.]|nr:hypothetical protein [Labilithrix sp.]